MGSIISFFNTLNNDDFDRRIPQSVVSNLSVGGDIQ
jgi:cytochrome c peroxidase